MSGERSARCSSPAKAAGRRARLLLASALLAAGVFAGVGSSVAASSQVDAPPTSDVEREPAPPTTDEAADGDEPADTEELEPGDVAAWQWILVGAFVLAAIAYMVLRNPNGPDDDDDLDAIRAPIDATPIDASPPDRPSGPNAGAGPGATADGEPRSGRGADQPAEPSD